jgi:aspartate/methionine/tyrosine aminotransferase
MLERALKPSRLESGLRASIEALPASKIREVANAGMGRRDIIPLWFGEPDVPTPEFICEAAAKALREGDTFYQPNRGVPLLRETLAGYMNDLYGTDLGPEHVTVSVSGMNALMLVMQSLIEPGDAVVTTTPSWPNLPAVPQVLGGEIRSVPLIPAADGWTLDLERLFAACDTRARALFLNSPNNPTGWMMTGEQQRSVLEFARSRGLWIVADEVYARIVYDQPFAPSFLQIAEPSDRLIVVNSFSKSWAMTGWRLGWITAPPEVGPVLEKLTEFNIAGPAGFIQQAGVVAVRDGEGFVREIGARYGQARDLVVERIGAMPGVFLPKPHAAFYAFMQVQGLDDSLAFAKELLQRTGVGLAPGAAFGPGGEGNLRLCFAASRQALKQALDRLEGFLVERGG